MKKESYEKAKRITEINAHEKKAIEYFKRNLNIEQLSLYGLHNIVRIEEDSMLKEILRHYGVEHKILEKIRPMFKEAIEEVILKLEENIKDREEEFLQLN